MVAADMNFIHANAYIQTKCLLYILDYCSTHFELLIFNFT